MAETPAIPEYLKKFVAQPTANADAESMASASMSVPRVSLRAKKFRFIDNSEEVFAETTSHVVILAVEPSPGKFVKTYYQGVYAPGDTSPPTCSSSDGIRPDAWVTSPQNEVCATCQWNQFGSATSQSGKKSKKCRDSKRLWVVRADDIDGTVYGLNVPVTSLKNLSELGNTIKVTGLPISAAVIELSMFDDESYPIVMFSLVGWLNQEFGTKAISRNELKDWPGVLKGPNPPVLANTLDQQKIAAPAQPSATPAEKTIEGTATPVPQKPNNVNEALKTWG